MRDNNREEDDHAGQQQTNVTPMPKHIPFPDPASSSELLNELIMFLFTSCVAAMQFINVYRTNWWLPQQQVQITNTVNLQHVNPHLILLILVMNGRRIVYCLSLKGLYYLLPPQFQSMSKIFKYILEVLILTLPVTCIVMMYNNRNYLSIFLLIYPFIVYFLAFGLALEPFLRFNYEIKGGAYFNGFPLHCCSANPNGIRFEIDVLRNDFNCRFKQVIFTSLFNTYYSAFLPCYFAHAVHYNVLWASQHIVLVFLSVFQCCTVFSFPSKYSDILHRAAVHLGYWLKMEERPGAESILSVSNWIKSTLWAPSSVVKFTGELYRSVGPVTVAIPGNVTHERFYKLFHNPSVIYGSLSAIQACIVLSGISLLYYAIEWHFILSLSFITLTNQFTFFKLMRDFLITKRVYLAETSVSDIKLKDN
ncbi:transmembrane protein 39A [Haematobia irritans]|uniref:transmembrane protein 39A n=1 Tax=Haematobia irritans TaxID=7368 RepID=UPI003F503B42